MPFKIRKVNNMKLYKVTNAITGKLYGYSKDPIKFIQAVEINKKHKK